ncbi:VOC family protein [Loktanella sp. F6476L]|uniref:VOC family protein n=1 Tax=Loktanella sp. F6476L TaxID=2926405 RepID=UPI001FF3F1CA|nr:VOC family protein [Loktanella sp. F6476L]MCK0119788.1 VOC family protein [Loktanella sp. F6476L]
MMAELEHINVTVADPTKMAGVLNTLFGWEIRWEGEAMAGEGYTVHVGTERTYLALYTGSTNSPTPLEGRSYNRLSGLNHIGVVVDDLDAVETRVKDLGYTPTSHADYEPGRRFYFTDENKIEIEVICYA